MKNKTKNSILVGLFVIAFLVSVVAIFRKNIQIMNVSIPLIFVSLIIMYIGSVKKPNIYFVAYLFLSLISESLFLFKEKYFFYVLLTTGISQIILIAFIISFKHLKYATALFYFVATVIFYLIIYKYVIETPSNIMLIIVGLINSVLASFAMVNHLRKMYLANYLLFLGVAFKVLNYAMASLDLFNSNANIYPFIIDIISYFFICRSFIARVNRLPKKRRLTTYKE